MGGIFYDDWKMLTEARNVKSVYLTHLIRAYDDEKAYKTLVDILDDKMLKASFSRRNNYIDGVEKLCHYYNIPFFNILNKFPFGDFNENIQKMYYSKNGSTPDGTHPNNNGHLIIFEQIATNLLSLFTSPNNAMLLTNL